jgi:hypothetical protein
MALNSHPFLGFPAEAVICRKSFLIDAKSFRVGTFFSMFFLPFSIARPL